MSHFSFWGNFSSLLDPSTTSGKHRLITDRQAAQAEIARSGPANEMSLFFVTEENVRKNPELFQSPSGNNGPVTVLVYETSQPLEVLVFAKEFPAINHLLPAKSANSKSRINSLMTLNGGQSSLGDFFIPHSLNNAQQVILHHTNECAKAYEDLEQYVRGLKVFTEFPRLTAITAYELVSNAFFNGRRNPKTGKPLITDRKEKFALGPGENVEFSYGTEDGYLWLIVKDYFGSLDRATVMRALSRAAKDRTAIISEPGGAGLGMMMVYSWSTETNFQLREGKSTTVGCKFLLTPRNRVFDSEPSALHIN